MCLDALNWVGQFRAQVASQTGRIKSGSAVAEALLRIDSVDLGACLPPSLTQSPYVLVCGKAIFRSAAAAVSSRSNDQSDADAKSALASN